MKTLLRGAAFAGLFAVTGIAAAGGNVNGSVGIRHLNDDVIKDIGVDKQPMIGVLADFALGSTPLHIATGLQVSADENDTDGYDITAAVADLSVGLKVMARSGSFRPYAGAGFVSTGASVEDEYYDDDDTDQSFGYYFGGGALFRIGKHFNLGADLRWIAGGEVELFETEFDTDSFTASVLIGYGWGE